MTRAPRLGRDAAGDRADGPRAPAERGELAGLSTPTRAWLVVVVLAIGVGPLVTLEVSGQPVVVSAIDVAAVALGAHGLVDAMRRGPRLDPALVPLGAILAVLAVQLVVAGDAVAVMGGISRFVTAGGVLFGLGQLRRDDDARPAADGLLVHVTWWRALVGGGALLAAMVLVDWAGAVLDPARGNFYEVKNSVVTPLGASNYLAAFLLVALFVGVGWWRADPLTRPATVLVGCGLLATMSRAALLATAAVLVGAAVTRRLGARRGATLAGGALALLLGLFLLANSGLVGDPPPGLRTPVGDRAELFEAAGEAFVDDPVLGVGINRFATVNEAGQDHAHNLVLHGLATTGLVGLAAYLWWWSVLARRLWRAAAGPARTALALAAVGLFVHAQLEALSHTRAVEVLVALLLVLAATLPPTYGRPAGRAA